MQTSLLAMCTWERQRQPSTASPAALGCLQHCAVVTADCSIRGCSVPERARTGIAWRGGAFLLARPVAVLQKWSRKQGYTQLGLLCLLLPRLLVPSSYPCTDSLSAVARHVCTLNNVIPAVNR